MKKAMHEILSFSIYLLVVVCSAYLVIVYVGQRTEVIGDSMNPTLENADNLIVDKISYYFGEPQRYDIIVFRVKKEDEKYFIKRIVALPGETVYISEEGKIYVKEQEGEYFPIEDPYGLEAIDETNRGRACEPVTLAEDEYFVLGDNRNHSTDSRSTVTVTQYTSELLVGNVKKDRIIGRAWIRIWPLSTWGELE